MKPHHAALITGGSKRLGRTIAMRLATLGYDIALHYNSSGAQAQKTASDIKAKKRTCQLFQCNLNSEEETLSLITQAKRRFPRLSLLVNNASLFHKSSLRKLDLAQLNLDMNIHFKAPYILMSEFARLCKQGNIINLLDTNIVKDKTTHVSYLLSKKALHHLTLIGAVELAPKIRVNGIAPGLVLAPGSKGTGYLDRLAQSIPLKRRGKPEQIADCIEFLVRHEYLTGQVLFNDGGEHLIAK